MNNPSPDQEVWLRFATAMAGSDEWNLDWLVKTADKLLEAYKTRFP